MTTKLTGILLTTASVALVLAFVAASASAQPPSVVPKKQDGPGVLVDWDLGETAPGAALIDPFDHPSPADWDPLQVAIDGEIVEPFSTCSENVDLADPFDNEDACGLMDPWRP